MKQSIIVKQGQSFLDLVIQATGDLDNAFKMALKNGIGITDSMTIGQGIIPGTVTDKDAVKLFTGKHQPATLFINNDPTLSPNPGGIGYMIIEDTFIVS